MKSKPSTTKKVKRKSSCNIRKKTVEWATERPAIRECRGSREFTKFEILSTFFNSNFNRYLQKNTQSFDSCTENFLIFGNFNLYLTKRQDPNNEKRLEGPYTSLVSKILVYYLENSGKWTKCWRVTLLRSLAFLVLFFVANIR